MVHVFELTDPKTQHNPNPNPRHMRTLGEGGCKGCHSIRWQTSNRRRWCEKFWASQEHSVPVKIRISGVDGRASTHPADHRFIAELGPTLLRKAIPCVHCGASKRPRVTRNLGSDILGYLGEYRASWVGCVPHSFISDVCFGSGGWLSRYDQVR